jgi:hypothetical protein
MIVTRYFESFQNKNDGKKCNKITILCPVLILVLVPFCRSQEAEAPCLWCSCINGLRQGEARWRYETWVTALAALAGILAVIYLPRVIALAALADILAVTA